MSELAPIPTHLITRYQSHEWLGLDDDDRCAACFVQWSECDDYCPGFDLKGAIRAAYAEADADARPVLDVNLLRGIAPAQSGDVLDGLWWRQCLSCGHDWERHGTEAGGCIECRCRRAGGAA